LGLAEIPGGGAIVALNMLHVAREQILFDVKNGNI